MRRRVHRYPAGGRVSNLLESGAGRGALAWPLLTTLRLAQAVALAVGFEDMDAMGQAVSYHVRDKALESQGQVAC